MQQPSKTSVQFWWSVLYLRFLRTFYMYVCVWKKSESVWERVLTASHHMNTTFTLRFKDGFTRCCVAVTSRHRGEVLHIQGILQQGSRQQLWSQDGMLFHWRLQRSAQEPQPRRPSPQRCRGSGHQPHLAGHGPAAAHGLHSALNTCNFLSPQWFIIFVTVPLREF